MATQKQIFTEAKNGLDSANHTVSGLIGYLRYIFGKLENATGGGGGGSVVSYTQTATSGAECGTKRFMRLFLLRHLQPFPQL